MAQSVEIPFVPYGNKDQAEKKPGQNMPVLTSRLQAFSALNSSSWTGCVKSISKIKREIIFLCQEGICIYKRLLSIYGGLESQGIAFETVVISLEINEPIVHTA